MKRLIIPILSIMLLASVAFAEEVTIPVDEGGKVKNPPAQLQLEYKFKVGEHRRYDMVILGDGSLQLPGQKEKAKLETRTDLTFIQTVEAYVPKDEIWRMEWDMIKGALTLQEFGEITLTIPSLQFEMNKYGTISKVTGLEELAVAPGLPQQDGMAKTLSQLTSVGFPQKPLKVGDTWEQEFKIEVEGQEPIAVKTKSKLLDYEVMEGADCAKILTTYEIPFKLKDKPKAKDDKDSEAAKSETSKSEESGEEKPAVLIGKESGEFCAHFAYGEGKVMRVTGTLDIIADLEGKKMSTDEFTAPRDASPETAAEMKAEFERSKHDVAIKYTMTSVFNPKMPETAVEKKK